MTADRPELAPLDAPTLVEASAGTGKTYTITTYFVRAILELDLEPEQILVLTFTNAATSELRGRSRKRIGQAIALLDGPPKEPDALHEVVSGAVERLGRLETERRLRNALAEMDQAPILTIHGFCQRLLQDYPLLFGVDVDFEVNEDAASMHSELAVDFWSSELYDEPEWLLSALNEAKVGPERLSGLAKLTVMPDLEVLGPEPRAFDEDAMTRFLDSKRIAGEIWSEQRREVLATLQSAEGLNKRTYNPGSIAEKWVPELDGYFSETQFSSPPKSVSNLARGRMRMNKGHTEPVHAFFEACGSLVDAYDELGPMLDSAVFDFQLRFLEFVREASRRRRDETGVLTYDDLLTTVYSPLDPNGAEIDESVRERIVTAVSKAYPLALIDEFQDTDSIQYGIFKAIYGDGAAIYVGDPKQAIYSFRGADVFSYIDAAADAGARRHTLKTNRRSDPSMVQAVNALFEHRDRPFIIEEIEFEGALAHAAENRSNLEPSMEVLFVPEDELKGTLADVVAPIVANEIALLLESDAMVEERAVRPDDVAVLCRSNSQAIAVTDALRALNIPASLDGGSNVLDTEVASDLRAVLEAALTPGDSRVVRRALLTTLLGVSPEELGSMSEEQSSESDALWAEWVSRFRHWHALWHDFGVLRFLEDMLRVGGGEARLASHPEGRRDLADLFHLEELLLRGERERRSNPFALMQWFRRLSEGSAEIARDELQRRPDAQSDAVRVCTIHKSKGLEYGIVYCPFTWENSRGGGSGGSVTKFHDKARRLRVDLGSADLTEHKEIAAEEELSDALRLLYVAVTRAKHRCTLFWGKVTGWKKSALRYLLHGDEGFEKLKEPGMREAVLQLAASSSGTIACRGPNEQRAEPRQTEETKAVLELEVPTRSYNPAPRIASFTSLTGHDEKLPMTPSGFVGAEPEAGLFEGLTGGARTGLLLHSILEHANFESLGSTDTLELIARQLRASGFDEGLAPDVQRDIELVGSTPLIDAPGAPRLMDLGRDRQLRELEFTLSVDRPTLDELAGLLKRFAAPTAAPGYHERLSELSSQRLLKYLRGFIDLVFEWGGRWYVADYKSNTLPSYAPDSLAEAVQREHYLLQAQLYTAAAHRHLRERLPGYEPEEHWGGAMFLFLRGMRGPGQETSSVFFDQQPAELIRETDRWLGGLR